MHARCAWSGVSRRNGLRAGRRQLSRRGRQPGAPGSAPLRGGLLFGIGSQQSAWSTPHSLRARGAVGASRPRPALMTLLLAERAHGAPSRRSLFASMWHHSCRSYRRQASRTQPDALAPRACAVQPPHRCKLWRQRTGQCDRPAGVPRAVFNPHSHARCTPHSLRLSSTPQDNAQSLGLNVVRMWGFCDGQRAGALQPRAGEFDERVFAGLDWVLAEAAKRDVRLIICFTNYWDDFGAPWRRAAVESWRHSLSSHTCSLARAVPAAGGIKQYVSWAQDAGEQLYHKEGARRVVDTTPLSVADTPPRQTSTPRRPAGASTSSLSRRW